MPRFAQNSRLVRLLLENSPHHLPHLGRTSRLLPHALFCRLAPASLLKMGSSDAYESSIVRSSAQPITRRRVGVQNHGQEHELVAQPDVGDIGPLNS